MKQYIIPIKGGECEIEVLSQSTIYCHQLNIEKKQPFEDFKDFLNLSICYKNTDCLILVNEETMEKLNENQPILISEVEQFGWYSYDIHEQKKSLYEKIEPQRFEANLRRNQNLQFKSFQVTRNQKILQRQINFLTGAFGLCYYKFREEYEVFFSKIDIHNDKWVISKNKNIIFLQLFALTP